MPVAKHLSYTRSRSRTERARRDEALRARSLQPSSWARSAIAETPVRSRSILAIVARFAETVGEAIFTGAVWLLSEMLDGCAAYALAMYGIPSAINDAEAGDATASERSDALGQPPRAALQLISSGIRASKIPSPSDSVRSEQPARGRSSWRMAVIAPVVLLLSKLRERSAHRRAIVELQCLDDRSLRDIGISRTDIGHIARYGVRPE